MKPIGKHELADIIANIHSVLEEFGVEDADNIKDAKLPAKVKDQYRFYIKIIRAIEKLYSNYGIAIQCNICGEVIGSKDELHLVVTKNGDEYYCEKCGKEHVDVQGKRTILIRKKRNKKGTALGKKNKRNHKK